jgi:hypothetical protein
MYSKEPVPHHALQALMRILDNVSLVIFHALTAKVPKTVINASVGTCFT